MSFGYELKKELSQNIAKSEGAKSAQLYGMLLFCDVFSKEQIFLSTENENVITVFCELLSEVIGVLPKLNLAEHGTLKNVILYSAKITDLGEIDRIRRFYSFKPNDGRRINEYIDKVNAEDMPFFICGAYLSCGNVTDPQKGYHIEFVTESDEICDDLHILVSGYIATAKKSHRKGHAIVYIKDSEEIEDLVTFMGATQCTMEIINAKILKDVRNRVNRLTNCDNANLDKTVTASIKQIEDIKLIFKNAGEEGLPEHLIELAHLRLENPEASLNELGEMLSTPISRSGINHRLKKISEIAEKYKE